MFKHNKKVDILFDQVSRYIMLAYAQARGLMVDNIDYEDASSKTEELFQLAKKEVQNDS
jgi:hypothetical protein